MHEHPAFSNIEQLTQKVDPEVQAAYKEFEAVLLSSEYTPEKALNLLKPQFPGVYESSAGVWEGYTIEDHTLMVMKQFEKYFGKCVFPAGLTLADMRLILAFHDIGKPEAIKKGDKHLQHECTHAIISDYFPKAGINKRLEKLALALTSGDPLGNIVANRQPLEQSVREIQALAQSVALSIEDFFDILQAFYQVDAGSYTLDAGGKPSLDRLFVFDQYQGQLHFASFVQEKVDGLKAALKQE